MIRRAWYLLLLLVSLAFVSSDGRVRRSQSSAQTGQKINLAIRRTAHHLLRAGGDSTSRIEPVRQLGPGTFAVRLNQTFDYERLPKLLDESLKLHQLNSPYDVLVVRCENEELELGYTLLDYERKEVPCANRNREPGCFDLRVTLSGESAVASPLAWLVPASLLVLVGWVFFRRSKPTTTQTEGKTTETREKTRLTFGQSEFDDENLFLFAAGQQHQLTYREAKLLRLFVNHPNQLLERDFIMKSVWEDEGIVVGRSLDVFVSRLRKLLQADASVQIVTVHGVGYRFHV